MTAMHAAPARYAEFLAAKAPAAPLCGLVSDDLPTALKPFQADLVRWALRRGCAAIFAGTGLGKTLMQLSWANAIATSTRERERILILTPLAVAQQTIAEAAKFGIEGVAYAADEAEAESRVVVTNYDRFAKFDLTAYGAIVLDESSILKAHDSKTRIALTEACRSIPYRLCCTATPAPNDWTELGNHSEFLGALTAKEMLATFFVHDGSIRASGDGDGWRLKRHAEGAFWRWVASWAALVRHPRDLGYEDELGYDLPPLSRHQVTVRSDFRPSGEWLFPPVARTLKERLSARRESIADRAAAAARIVNGQPDRSWLVWCNLNAEAEAVTRAIPGAVEVRGSDPAESKAERLLGFMRGTPRILVSKPSIAGFGLNYQHCADMVFVGLNDSFEQLYQAIRRCWRFGQTRPVSAYFISAEREGAVVANIAAKERAFEAMGEAMAENMRDLTRHEVLGQPLRPFRKPSRTMEIPAWI